MIWLKLVAHDGTRKLPVNSRQDVDRVMRHLTLKYPSKHVKLVKINARQFNVCVEEKACQPS